VYEVPTRGEVVLSYGAGSVSTEKPIFEAVIRKT